ncbi:MAG: adenosine deaminase [Lachnospiraceae bacterium]|nr:adenosine deaminase [Lachnospiraceae bacterium]
MKKGYIDLHLHLDGAITPKIARKLAEKAHIKLPVSDEELECRLSVPETCENLNDFLKCFQLPLTLLQSEETIEEAVYLVQENIKKDGIIYAEIRFAPQLHCDGGLNQEQVILSALKGLKRSDLPCNLILCCMRGDDTKEKNFETIRLAEKYLVKDSGVVAIDLAGAEGLFPTKNFSEEFAAARKAGIPFTIHAGEADGAESVKMALEFGAVRIGHGVRIKEEEELLEYLKQKNICLEMCPTSNRQTKAVGDMQQYPLAYYLNKGLHVTVNTDDMAISRTTIQKEFEYIEKKFGISDAQKHTLLRNAVQSAFITDEKKEQLMQQI